VSEATIFFAGTTVCSSFAKLHIWVEIIRRERKEKSEQKKKKKVGGKGEKVNNNSRQKRTLEGSEKKNPPEAILLGNRFGKLYWPVLGGGGGRRVFPGIGPPASRGGKKRGREQKKGPRQKKKGFVKKFEMKIEITRPKTTPLPVIYSPPGQRGGTSEFLGWAATQ